MTRSHALPRILIAGFCCLGLLTASGAARADGPSASAAKACSAPKYPGSGYFTSLKVTHVGCSTGRKVTLSHYHCRTKSSKSGKCHARVRGYSCSEKRNSIPTEIDARVTCKNGTKRVVYTYQQNT